MWCRFCLLNLKFHLLLTNISPKTSPGSDNVPSILWSKLACFLSKPLTIIYNRCLCSADLPILWKQADVIIFPKTNPPNLKCVRPISLLPVPERIFEKQLLKNMGTILTSKIDECQFGYRVGSSTTCALLNIEDFVTRNLQLHDINACQILSLDLAKGFDKISFRLLQEKLLHDDIDPFMISFLCNYLSGRFQRVRWKTEHSDFLPVLSGIPQGSSLGPIIFAYFTSDLTLRSANDNICLIKYADDILIAGAISKHSCGSPILSVYFDIVDWAVKKKMSIKEEKSTQIFITSSKSYDLSCYFIPMIPVKTSLKFLGVIIDEHFTWNLHVNQIAKKASSKLSVLRQLKPFVDRISLITVYQCAIRGVLEYAAALFVNLQQKESDQLDRVQDRAHKIICGSSSCDCAYFIPLHYRRLIIGLKLFNKLVADISHPLHHLRPKLNHYSNSYRMPRISGSIRHKAFLTTMIRLANSGFT